MFGIEFWKKSIEAFRFYEILNFFLKKGIFTPSAVKFRFWAVIVDKILVVYFF